MIIDIKAKSKDGVCFSAQTVANSLNAVSKHHERLVALLENLPEVHDGDFIDTLEFNISKLKGCNVKLAINNKRIKGQVLKGNYKLIDIEHTYA